MSCGKVGGHTKISEAASEKYQGCTSSVSGGPFSIKVGFDFPVEATQVRVARDDIIIFQSSDHSVTSFMDENLEANSAHKYHCSIQVDGQIFDGLLGQDVTVADPLNGYTGCTKGESIVADTAQITFEFPDGATKAIVSKNGTDIFSTSDTTIKVANIDGLDPGKIYSFSCKVEVNGVLREGTSKVTVSIPDPLSVAFNGCLTATPISASVIKLEVQFPDGAESVEIKRDGDSVFSTTTADSREYSDEGLGEGQEYVYSCIAHLGTREKTGTSVFKIRTLKRPELSFAGAKGTTGFVNTPMTVEPSSLSLFGQAAIDCGIKAGTTALPAGFSVNATTCTVSGTATSPSPGVPPTYSIVVKTASGTSSDAHLVLTISAKAPSLSFQNSDPNGQVGHPLTITPVLIDNGAPISSCALSSGALPAGLSISPITCIISGFPTAAAAHASLSIIATNSAGGSDEANLVIVIIN